MSAAAEGDSPVKTALREWIALDDEARKLAARAKEIREEKQKLSGVVLEFMRENDVDDFKLENTGGTISRSVRTVKPALKRSTIRTQLLLEFADQPQRVSQVLRAIEGIPEDGGAGDDGGSVVVQKELLTRRVAKK
jgi:seryl-tRNA synthetase